MMKMYTSMNHSFRTVRHSFFYLILLAVWVISCTDMQQNSLYDEEELNLMVEFDRTGDRGYHQVIIYMGDENQAERHSDTISQLDRLSPDFIVGYEVIPGEQAVEQFGPRAANGAIVVKSRTDPDAYNTALRSLGLDPPPIPDGLNSPDSQQTEDYFVVVDEMPELVGGISSLQEKLQYPERARRAGIEGRVYVQFIVNQEGFVENPQVLRGIGANTDEEALRVISEAQFRPGYQQGEAVRVQMSLPVVFRLGDSNNNLTN